MATKPTSGWRPVPIPKPPVQDPSKPLGNITVQKPVSIDPAVIGLPNTVGSKLPPKGK